MSPEKALELVQRYADTNRKLKQLRQQIGEHLGRCNGVKGDRLNVDANGWPTYYPEVDEKNRDKGTHLWAWYQPEIVDDGYMSPNQVWQQVGTLEAEECPHCYAAHLAIQERKAARKTFGGIKAAMSRLKARES